MLVSFYILAFNQEKLIASAIMAALAQTYSPLQIIISDDCSTDSTWEVIQRTIANYDGPHSLVIRRNSTNLGISLHINAVWAECKGGWIVASAGDDVSSPTRTEKIMSVVSKNSGIMLVQSWLNETDAENRILSVNKLGVESCAIDDALFSIADRLAGRTYTQHGAAMSYSRDIFDFFGPLPAGVIFEDNIINVRAELLGLVRVLQMPMVNHRNHKDQITLAFDGMSDRVREERRGLRLLSDVISCKQNMADVRKMHAIPDETTNALIERFSSELVKLTAFQQAVMGRWPMKIVSLFSVVRIFSIKEFRKDDLMRALLPYFIYRLAKKVRR